MATAVASQFPDEGAGRTRPKVAGQGAAVRARGRSRATAGFSAFSARRGGVAGFAASVETTGERLSAFNPAGLAFLVTADFLIRV